MNEVSSSHGKNIENRTIPEKVKNSAKYKRLIKTNKDIRKVIISGSFLHDEVLITIILNSADEFKHLIRNIDDLHETAKLFPAHANALINMVIKCPYEFKRIIKYNSDLLEIVKLLPRHADSIINVVLKCPNEFKRLIKHDFDLRKLAELFPWHAVIFGKPSVDEAAHAAKSYAQRKSYAEIRKMRVYLPEPAEQKLDLLSLRIFLQNYRLKLLALQVILQYIMEKRQKISPIKILTDHPYKNLSYTPIIHVAF